MLCLCGGMGIWDNSAPLALFCCESKTSLKKKQHSLSFKKSAAPDD